MHAIFQEREEEKNDTKTSHFYRFWRWGIFSAALVFLIVGSVSGALAQAVPGGTLDPLTIPKYVIPLVIPPVMNNTGTANDYDIAVRQFQQQILPGGILEHGQRPCGRIPADHGLELWTLTQTRSPIPRLWAGVGIAPAPNSQFNYPAYTVENMGYGATTTVDWINDLVRRSRCL